MRVQGSGVGVDRLADAGERQRPIHGRLNVLLAPCVPPPFRIQRVLFIDNLLVRIHFVVEMILVEWPCAMGA